MEAQVCTRYSTNDAKVYVNVLVAFDQDGRMLPRKLKWEDGIVYTIDRVIAIRPSYAARAGGQGDRYTIKVNNQEAQLFFERSSSVTGNNIGRWFVERRVE